MIIVWAALAEAGVSADAAFVECFAWAAGAGRPRLHSLRTARMPSRENPTILLGLSGTRDTDFSAVQTDWRRGRDSNPRYPLRYVRFRDGSFQPLTHLSAWETFVVACGQLPATPNSEQLIP